MEDNDLFFAPANWLESLIHCREHLKDSELLSKLDEIITMELEMAHVATKKALTEVTKDKGHLRSIK